ncbi:hypothetical protein BZG04_08180, partial [Salinivibrio kushneri]|uniref:glycosyltransferase family 4 protein n=1 Tax=Salinivibrio kushneri TaxID=1908198 RepID=UPI0009897031
DLYFIILARVFNRKVFVHLKGGNYKNFYWSQGRVFRKLIEMVLMKADRILVLGKGLKSMFDFHDGLFEKIYVVENGLPFESPGIYRKSLSEKRRSPFRVLYLSNMIDSKGYMDVLKAIKILKDRGFDVEADFAGKFIRHVDDEYCISETEAETKFKKYIEDNGLDRRVLYHGVVDGTSKSELLEGANVLCLPTNYDNEGQPVSIIEALAFGLPIISTKYRAIPDMVKQNVTGFYVGFRRPEEIADKVQILMSDRCLYEEMSHNALDLFNSKFTKEAHLKRINRHILDAIE